MFYKAEPHTEGGIKVIVMLYSGKVKDFRKWLTELQPKADNIIYLNDWKKKRAAKAANCSTPIIA